MVGSWKLDPFVRLCNYAVHNSIHSPRYRCLTNSKFLTNTLLIYRVTQIACYLLIDAPLEPFCPFRHAKFSRVFQSLIFTTPLKKLPSKTPTKFKPHLLSQFGHCTSRMLS
ncbi:unnamed protein product [Acanthoscelides obtectus]|uniref:Uncharacterized protein n=1 Tax=Acanthoscelides obtectus TaxID=200917 RepID=A0A9P0PX12_ACAOB|nr:unnamed protein product [Acanthoscelides obtectus]CAK1620768.1 hypothetical protein AOBTE_LOCUS554 [Acanthoscelides obtectus]